ncbi:MAG: hypothetical protein WBQ89_27290, partial [Candidatus Acidiferrum sp.]
MYQGFKDFFTIIGVLLVVAGSGLTQESTFAAQTNVSPNQASATQEFGKSYETLRPVQRQLIDDYIRNYNTTTG